MTIENLLKQHLKKNDIVIIGVSGGPDSVFLLHHCHKLALKFPLKIIVAHLNHNLRGKESDLDEQFVKKLSAAKGLIFETKKIRKIGRGNVEEQARIARYSFFESLLKKYRAACIITAHHRDDNIETVLFNLIRGSFLDGITGMETFSPGRKIFRPLLNLSKVEILQYLTNRRIKYRTDKSNLDTKLSRNLIRHQIIPLIKKINPNFENTFSRNIALFKETSSFIRQISSLVREKEHELNLDNFLAQPEIIKKTIISQLYRELHGNAENFNQDHLAQILDMLEKRKTGLKKEFGSGYFICVSRNRKNQRIIKLVGL